MKNSYRKDLEYNNVDLCTFFDKRGLLLDLGSGDGNRSLFLKNNGVPVVAVDIQKDLLLKYAKKICCIQCDIHYLPFISQLFSSILCTEVLEHSVKPSRVIKECNRILKYNGKVVWTTPCANLPFLKSQIVTIHRKMFQKRASGINYDAHKQLFSTDDLCDLLKKHFTILSVIYTRFTIPLRILFGLNDSLDKKLQNLSSKNKLLKYVAQGNIIICKKRFQK